MDDKEFQAFKRWFYAGVYVVLALVALSLCAMLLLVVTTLL